MKNRGVTLIELMLVLMMSGILGLTLVSQFIAEQRFRGLLQDERVVLEEADIAMHHMTRALRFAFPNTKEGPDNVTFPTTTDYPEAVQVYIEGGHITPFNDSDFGYQVTYRWKNSESNPSDPHNKTLEYIAGTNEPVILARNIENFDCAYSGPKKEFTITLTVKKENGKTVALRTKVTLLVVPNDLPSS